MLPKPADVFRVAATGLSSGVLRDDLLGTLGRTLIATGIASAGIPIGIVLGSRPVLYEAFEFLIEFFRSTPSTAMFPLGLRIIEAQNIFEKHGLKIVATKFEAPPQTNESLIASRADVAFRAAATAKGTSATADRTLGLLVGSDPSKGIICSIGV